MTSTDSLATLNPSVVGQAEKAHTAVLTRVLRGTTLDERQWITLQLALGAGPIARRALVDRVTSAARYDTADVERAIDALATAGLASDRTGEVRVTEAGQAQVSALRAEVADLIGPAYASVPEADRVVAARALAGITAALGVVVSTESGGGRDR